MNAMTFLLDQYFYLHIKRRHFFPSTATEQTEKVPYQARMCVKDSFVKCWQQPHKPLPSLSSPPTRPGGCQKIPQYGLVLAPCHSSQGGRWLYRLWCRKGHHGYGWQSSYPAALGAAWNVCETAVSDTVNTLPENTPYNCSNNTLDRAERTRTVLSLPKQLAH